VLGVEGVVVTLVVVTTVGLVRAVVVVGRTVVVVVRAVVVVTDLGLVRTVVVVVG